jgi:hypothetical protein
MGNLESEDRNISLLGSDALVDDRKLSKSEIRIRDDHRCLRLSPLLDPRNVGKNGSFDTTLDCWISGSPFSTDLLPSGRKRG